MRISSVGIVIFHRAFGNFSVGNARGWLQLKQNNRPTRHSLRVLKILASVLIFVVCTPCLSFPSLTILVPLWFIIISLVFFCLSKLLFSGSFNAKVILCVAKIFWLSSFTFVSTLWMSFTFLVSHTVYFFVLQVKEESGDIGSRCQSPGALLGASWLLCASRQTWQDEAGSCVPQ